MVNRSRKRNRKDFIMALENIVTNNPDGIIHIIYDNGLGNDHILIFTAITEDISRFIVQQIITKITRLDQIIPKRDDI